MAEKGTNKATAWQKLSKREQAIVFITVFAVAAALLYQFPYRLMGKSINELRTRIETLDNDLVALSVQIADVKAREAEIAAGAKGGLAGWNLSNQRGVVLVMDGLSAEAKRQGIDLLSVHPSQELNKEKYKEVAVNLDLKGRYRDLAAYFKNLENLEQIVSIRKVRIEACPDASSACATQIEAVTYMDK